MGRAPVRRHKVAAEISNRVAKITVRPKARMFRDKVKLAVPETREINIRVNGVVEVRDRATGAREEVAVGDAAARLHQVVAGG